MFKDVINQIINVLRMIVVDEELKVLLRLQNSMGDVLCAARKSD